MSSSVVVPEPVNQSSPAKAVARPGKQGLFCVWHGLNWSTWQQLQREVGPFPAKNRLRRASISAVSLLNSWHEMWENLFYRRRIEQTVVHESPIFVLGHWRSGTTLLHNLFTHDPLLTYPTLYQVMFAGHFLLTERTLAPLTGWAIPKTRPMDNIPAGWDMSQEDEVALQLRTLLSAYMLLAWQGQREKYERLFELSELTPDELALWKREFLQLLKKVTIRSNRRIVLKSPPHTYRIPLLLEMFPQAKFVYIHRDPYAVYNSTLHLRRNVFADNALGECNFEGVEEDVLATYEHCIRRYEATKHLIPAGNLHELRFDDLEADPLGEMRQIYERLQLPGWEAVEPKLQAQMSEHTSYRKNRFTMDLATRRMVYERCRFAFDQYGYDSQLDDVSGA